MTATVLRMRNLSIPGIAETELPVAIPDGQRLRMVVINPEGGSWGGLFDLDKALLVTAPEGPARPALQLLADEIRRRVLDWQSGTSSRPPTGTRTG